MSTLNGHTPKPLLTREDVSRWSEEKAQAEQRIAADQALVAMLARKLEAAAVFMDVDVSAFDLLTPVETPVHAQRATTLELLTPASTSLPEAIRRAVSQSKRPITPKAIRRSIASGPDAALMKSANYLYTAIARAVAKGEIIKKGDGYAPAPVS